MMSTVPAGPARFERIPRNRRRLLAVATLLGLPAMFAWSTFWPFASTWPQSPNTANEYDEPEPAGTWEVNCGDALVASRSVAPRYTR